MDKKIQPIIATGATGAKFDENLDEYNVTDKKCRVVFYEDRNNKFKPLKVKCYIVWNDSIDNSEIDEPTLADVEKFFGKKFLHPLVEKRLEASELEIHRKISKLSIRYEAEMLSN